MCYINTDDGIPRYSYACSPTFGGTRFISRLKHVGFSLEHVLNIIYNHADFPFDSIPSLS